MCLLGREKRADVYEYVCVRGMCMGNNAAIQWDSIFVLSSAFQCLQAESPPCLVRRNMGHVLMVRDGHVIRAPELGSGNLSTLK